jgi:hypothetical protein
LARQADTRSVISMFSSGAYRASIGARLRRSLLVGVGVAAVSLALASGALASTTITNSPAWDGTTSSQGFGYTTQFCCTATYGQTVTVPVAPDTVLDSFTFYVDLPTNAIFRGEVYAWTPNTVDLNNFYALGSATGPELWGSGQTSTTGYSGTPPFTFTPITFSPPGGIDLTAGAQYVLFFTISKDYAANAGTASACSPPYTPACGFVGITAGDTIPGGDWVYQGCTSFDFSSNPQGNCLGGPGSGIDPSDWTTVGWTHPAAFPGCPPCFFGDDLAFKASFSSPLPTSKAQCMKGGWKTYGVFKNQGDCVSFVASGGKNPPSGP